MNHSIGVTMKFADFAAGGSDHPRTPRGDLVGRDHRLALRSAAGAARSAWAATGVTLECPDELWQAGLEAARTVIGPGRDPRQYAPEIPVAAAASPRQRFLAFTGRAEPC